MAISRSMEFPENEKKSNYAALAAQQSNESQNLPTAYIPVVGPQGPKGNDGLPGKDGQKGEAGAQGSQGQRGERGVPGKDGLSYFPTYEQNAGWASYSNKDQKPVKLAADLGLDGWVNVYVDGLGSGGTEEFLPRESISLYNPETRRINLKGLKLGSQLQVVYNFELTTFSSNTEVWVKSLFPDSKDEVVSFAASLKYQYTYELSTTHNLYLSKNLNRISGIVPQIRTDMNSIAKIKSIYISVF